MDQSKSEPVSALFLRHAASAAKQHFGENNAGIANDTDPDVGSFFINMKPASATTPTTAHDHFIIDELRVIVCGFDDETLTINFETICPYFTNEMLQKIDRNLTKAALPFGMTAGSTQEMPMAYAITLNGLDIEHLTEQTEFVVNAIHDGITNPQLDM